MGSGEHVSVLTAEYIRLLAPRPGGRFIDCTVDGARPEAGSGATSRIGNEMSSRARM